MPSHSENSRSRRGVWGHWVPLAVTLTVATVGLAVWAWSQRKEEDEDEHEPGLDYDNVDPGVIPSYGATTRDDLAPQQQPRPNDESYGVGPAASDSSVAGWGTRMSGALRRTPSPQQFLDSTGKTVAAGVAAAGAAVGKALSSIREEDKAYGDRNPWSDEADAKKDRSPKGSARRKTVALVISADTHFADTGDESYHQEHASILSHIPLQNDFSAIKLFILIYAPGLKGTAADGAASDLPPASLSSSFSNIGHDQAQTPAEEIKNPLSRPSFSAFNAIYSQALSLVEKDTMILPFTTPNGHVHILRHIQPEVVYLQESMAGDHGGVVSNLQTWLRHDIILVVGAESGSGGLADSESEAEKPNKDEKWWQKPERVGRGRGVVVVDGMRVHDDWARRVQNRE